MVVGLGFVIDLLKDSSILFNNKTKYKNTYQTSMSVDDEDSGLLVLTTV